MTLAFLPLTATPVTLVANDYNTPAAGLTYTLTATNSQGTHSATAAVAVTAPPAATLAAGFLRCALPAPGRDGGTRTHTPCGCGF